MTTHTLRRTALLWLFIGLLLFTRRLNGPWMQQLSSFDTQPTAIQNNKSIVNPAAASPLWPDFSSQSIVSVHLWPNVNETQHEMRHFTIPGIEASPFLERVYNLTNIAERPLIWMADLSQGPRNRRRKPHLWCSAFVGAIHGATSSEHRPAASYLFILDWRDTPELSQEFYCPEVYKFFGPKNVFYLKRSIVVGRHWNDTTRSIDVGRIATFNNDSSSWSAAPIRHIGYGVRDDIIDAIGSIVAENRGLLLSERSNKNDPDLSSDLKRPLDVAHFWPCGGRGVDRGGKRPNSRLRDTVSCALRDWQSLRNGTAKTFVGLTGVANLQGRYSAQHDYVQSLLQHKIVVVAQKDNWEDHYRLFEALCSGALVFTDRMLTLPEGLEDGKSIVVYDNVTDMINKIEYYLWQADRESKEAIAREGRRISLNRHRSWHVMERLVFGSVRS